VEGDHLFHLWVCVKTFWLSSSHLGKFQQEALLAFSSLVPFSSGFFFRSAVFRLGSSLSGLGSSAHLCLCEACPQL
jgi:hypothetical protein